MNKKGALELSINAIVVLILAITILGLAVMFIKTQFTSITSKFTDVDAEIKADLVKKIRDSGELLVFNRQDITTSSGGKEEQFYMGIKNSLPADSTQAQDLTDSDRNDICFAVSIRCIKSLSNTATCVDGVIAAGDVVGGLVLSGQNKPVTWFKVFDTVDIASGESEAFPIYYQIVKANPNDSYLMEIIIYNSADNVKCATAATGWTVFQKKTFYVNVK